MNLLLLQQSDLNNASVEITGGRALHIHSVLRAKPGQRIKTGVQNGKTGTARIVAVSKTSVTLDDIQLDREPPAPMPLDLICALPRPQSFKKVLHFIASSGIRKAWFIHTEKVEKSYWNSSGLQDGAIRESLIEGMEQGGDPVMPQLFFQRSFSKFMDELPALFPSDSLRIIAHPTDRETENQTTAKHRVLAIGPEGGFTEKEVEQFVQAGFQLRAFGTHILRVEFALAYITGWLR